MHNLERTDINITDGLKQAGNRLHSPKKEFFKKKKSFLKAAYIDYDDKAANGSLHQLSPIWAEHTGDSAAKKKEKKKCHKLAYDLYGSSRPIINMHWEKLKAANGNNTLICPICGLKEASEMDHYIPRELMPEYSVHLTNLIPVCHYCNHDKLDKWLDTHGKRIFFNAYFDRDFPSPLLVCRIQCSPIDGYPEVSVGFSSDLSPDNPIHAVVLSTINALRLRDKYQNEADNVLRKELVRIRTNYTIQNNREPLSPKDFWDEHRQTYSNYVSDATPWNFIEIAVYTELASSPVMENWVINGM